MATTDAGSFTLLGQLTDTHVVDATPDGVVADEVFVDNNARLRSAVASLNAESPALDVVLGTGDLTNWGRPGEYDRLAELLEPLTPPFLPIPGNHDDRDLLRATFPTVPWVDASHASWVADAGGVRVVGLDSTIPGQPGAEFDEERRRWLREVLAVHSPGITILALHHPPFMTGVGWMDASGFLGIDRLESVLVEHPVDKIVCGHFHRPVSSTIAGIPVQVGLATVQHVDLDFTPGAGPSLIVDPVGYQIHRVAGSSVVTHTRYIDTPEDPSTARIIPSWADEF
jgi:3',5'-cyclic-AMP phosphodiesterase